MAKAPRKCRVKGCKAHPGDGSAYCYQHDPAKAKERTEARKRGGQSRSAPKTLNQTFELQTIPQVKDMLATVTNASLRGEIDLNRARTAGYLASLILACLKDYDLEKRMEELEKKLLEIENRKGLN